MAMSSKVTEKYQVTIPKDIRKEIGIKRGDEVQFTREDDKIVMFVKPKIKDPVKFLWGLAPSKKEAVELVRKARREMMERASREAK
ncbi:MAG: AbrB/MazE/SpoVT family DNA-binding domain-containing protein [Methanocellales archaeon]|nr:AbrB/MazE/SpoVT family DNA-binding domain-containing protein [Methanocellales archaeon]MDI6859400.1 AbrB/MazE/SpoVT family DNA-binding domain-containing protein [Methanocellales archaeon]MDI6903257.1 AbrB/MazE/SpoVT family DNA-binding domain-containing protein [Methanocellales archaeon]